MATKPHLLRPRARDLFGEIPVTDPEIRAYCALSGVRPDSRRFAYYVRAWNVPEKIRALKRAGRFAPADWR